MSPYGSGRYLPCFVATIREMVVLLQDKPTILNGYPKGYIPLKHLFEIAVC